MNWSLIALIGLALGILTILVWIDIRLTLHNFPAFRKLKWWQLLGGYVIGWAVVSLIVSLLS